MQIAHALQVTKYHWHWAMDTQPHAALCGCTGSPLTLRVVCQGCCADCHYPSASMHLSQRPCSRGEHNCARQQSRGRQRLDVEIRKATTVADVQYAMVAVSPSTWARQEEVSLAKAAQGSGLLWQHVVVQRFNIYLTGRGQALHPHGQCECRQSHTLVLVHNVQGRAGAADPLQNSHGACKDHPLIWFRGRNRYDPDLLTYHTLTSDRCATKCVTLFERLVVGIRQRCQCQGAEKQDTSWHADGSHGSHRLIPDFLQGLLHQLTDAGTGRWAKGHIVRCT